MSTAQLFLHPEPRIAVASGTEALPPILPHYLDSCHGSYAQAYSPPPSPTRMSSIPRFESRGLYYSVCNTPSLLDETLQSSMSSPSLAHTPMPYATTRDPMQESASFKGLGISGVFKHDGSMFDGMGALPKRNESADLGFFMDESNHYYGMDINELRGYPEQQEDAWRKRMSVPGTSTLFALQADSAGSPSFAGLWSPTTAPLGCSSPIDRTASKTPLSPMPTEPDSDDVFFTRSPQFASPFVSQFLMSDADALSLLQMVQGIH